MEKDSLWARVLQSKYNNNTHNNKWSTLNKRGSHIWKNIVIGSEVCERSIQWEVGNGESINVWQDA